MKVSSFAFLLLGSMALQLASFAPTYASDDSQTPGRYIACYRALKSNKPDPKDRVLIEAKRPCGTGATVFSDQGVFDLKIGRDEPLQASFNKNQGKSESPTYTYFRRFQMIDPVDKIEKYALIQISNHCDVSIKLMPTPKLVPASSVKSLDERIFENQKTELNQYLDINAEKLPTETWGDSSRILFEKKIIESLRAYKGRWLQSFQKLKKYSTSYDPKRFTNLKKIGIAQFNACVGLPERSEKIADEVKATIQAINDARLEYGSAGEAPSGKSSQQVE